MKHLKSFRANNVEELSEEEIRNKEFIFQHTIYNAAGNPTEVTTFNPDGTIEHTYKYKYDQHERLEDELLLEGDGEITEHRSMEYDANGRLAKEFVHYLDGSYDQLVYLYDQDGHLLSRRSIDSEGETGNYSVNVYAEGVLSSETEYDIAGEIITQRKLVYDEDGKIAEEIYKTPEEDYRLLYNYDENGYASVRRKYNNDKHLTQRNTFTYDSEGRLLETMDETSSGIEITFIGYDDAGNVVIQEEKTEDGKLLSSILRTYNTNNQLITNTVLSIRPHHNVPVSYRIRMEYSEE
jgi:YD repeat-containing protein